MVVVQCWVLCPLPSGVAVCAEHSLLAVPLCRALGPETELRVILAAVNLHAERLEDFVRTAAHVPTIPVVIYVWYKTTFSLSTRSAGAAQYVFGTTTLQYNHLYNRS